MMKAGLFLSTFTLDTVFWFPAQTLQPSKQTLWPPDKDQHGILQPFIFDSILQISMHWQPFCTLPHLTLWVTTVTLLCKSLYIYFSWIKSVYLVSTDWYVSKNIKFKLKSYKKKLKSYCGCSWVLPGLNPVTQMLPCNTFPFRLE